MAKSKGIYGTDALLSLLTEGTYYQINFSKTAIWEFGDHNETGSAKGVRKCWLM